MSQYSLPFEEMPKQPSNEKRTPLVYRGGKTTLTSWIIPYFPPHKIFVDVFGGGGGITFAKGPSENDIYNDIGNVSKFFRVLQLHGDAVYRRLYFTPYSRDYFYECCASVDSLLELAESEGKPENYTAKDIWIDWACKWYISLTQSFRREEDDDSWLVSKSVNAAKVQASHIDDFPQIISRLRNIIIENKDFAIILKNYDGKDTLFVMDPPYVPDTWEAEKGGYRNIMPKERHEELLEMACGLKGQVIICGYPSHLYDSRLTEKRGWKRVSKTRKGGIKNSSQEAGDRTEVLWLRTHHGEGLWTGATPSGTQTYVSGVYSETTYLEKLIAARKGELV